MQQVLTWGVRVLALANSMGKLQNDLAGVAFGTKVAEQ